MTILPEGEDLRKAVQWIAEMRTFEPETETQKLIDDACVKFDLSPLDAEHLARYLKTPGA